MGRCIQPGDTPSVILGEDEHRVVNECLPGLAADPDLYQRGGEFVTTQMDGDVNVPVIAPVPLPDLRRRVTMQVRLLSRKRTEDGERLDPAHPPEWLTPQLAHHPDKTGVRHLAGLSATPILRPDGSIHNRPGYDPETRVVHVPAGLVVPPIPARLTRADAGRAADELLDLVRDFPFADPAGKSVYLSLVLSPLARHLFDYGVPLHLADANVRGSGKGLLIDSAGVIVLGGPVPVQQFTEDVDETRKMITACVRAGRVLQHLDNLPTGEPFGNAPLDSALTGDVWEDRLLGQNLKVAYPHRTVWVASGNNTTVAADSMRRLVRLRLESNLANPEDRADFVYKDLLGHVRANRGRLVAAALTILAAFLRAGRPNVELPAAGSFGGWTGIVRAAIVWAGQPDPWLTNLAARGELDTERGELDALIDAWAELDPENTGITTAEAKKRSDSLYEDTPKTAELLTLVGLNMFDATAIGYLLRKHKGRRAGDGRSIRGVPGHTRVTRWRVEVIPPSPPASPPPSPPQKSLAKPHFGGDGGDGGDVSEPTRVRARACGGDRKRSPPCHPSPPADGFTRSFCGGDGGGDGPHPSHHPLHDHENGENDGGPEPNGVGHPNMAADPKYSAIWR
jgi:hypothetical protein